MPQSRRQFLRHTGLSIVGLLSIPPAFAKGWRVPYPLHNIPADKGLDRNWIKSLYERGKPTTYLKSRNELQYIGMPAGGLHAGTLYMGGDGRLWLWGIYNDDREGVAPKETFWNDGTKERKIRPRDGANYVDPPLAANKRVLEQGFALRITHRRHTFVRQLREEDFTEVSFEATHPLATVRYTDPELPVSVTLTGVAFYIPLNADDSALPATQLRIDIKNHSSELVEGTLVGWLENGVKKISGGMGVRKIDAIPSEKHTLLAYSYEASSGTAGAGEVDASKTTAGARDSGTMAFGLININGSVNTNAGPDSISDLFISTLKTDPSTRNAGEKRIGSIGTSASLKPGNSLQADYVLSWHFNHTLENLHEKMPESKDGYLYGAIFKDAAAVLQYIGANFQALSTKTRLWHQTYYDSTLPHWLLERAANFKTPFTTAQGWGTFSQQYGISSTPMKVRIHLAYGQLKLRTLSLALPLNAEIKLSAEHATSQLTLNGALVEHTIEAHQNGTPWSRTEGQHFLITFKEQRLLTEGQSLNIQIH